MKRSGARENKSASKLIDARIKELGDWRGALLGRLRTVIRKADPEIVEEVKWRKPSNGMLGVPVWEHAGIICTGETYKNVVKMTFAKGASLKDPSGLFNASLDGNTRRAIDFRDGDKIDEKALKVLIQAAVTLNMSAAKTKATRVAKEAKPVKLRKGNKPAVVLLSGGNPQIAKADGDAPVKAYIAAMPGWKRNIGKRLDALIARSVPNVVKAVKWNSPFYGIDGQGWFLSFHVFTRYVKVAFFRGASLRPVPPGESKDKHTRYLDIREDDELDEARIASWVKQAAALPGWIP
jgi:hypothetical protein